MRRITKLALLFLAIFSPATVMAAATDLSLSPFIPITLDAISIVSMATFKLAKDLFPSLIYIFLAVKITIYLFKMYMPKQLLGVLGFSGGGEMWDNPDAMNIVQTTLKPIIRAVIALAFLLQLSPKIMTEAVVDPLLKFGAIYTEKVLEATPNMIPDTPNQVRNISSENKLFTNETVDSMRRPLDALSQANNEFIVLGGKMTLHGLAKLSILTILSGLVMMATFFSSNLFIALLLLQAIFYLGLSFIMYPFYVLIYVVKDSKDWINPIPAFTDIFQSLKKLIITMIASAIVTILNIQMIKALYSSGDVEKFNSLMEIEDADALAGSFGFQSMSWLYAIILIFLYYKIFTIIRGKISEYGGESDETMYNNVKSDSKYISNTIMTRIKDMLKRKAEEKK